ncbi:hypothetical protein L6164_006306 [Bauhinia variegata]|uniref:Uncharacterized protein n=1 Tax=Bauhinia variegata TaxID=167791 RepID=A0ACB9PU28_BAUVA|nr:hypothetical protein L6164_006306 [Bauhinia variegata]
MDTKASPPKRIYEDFEPFCKWYPEEGQDTLQIHLAGFKKEQLKVQANMDKVTLEIYGEKPLNASKWSRFRKDVNLPKDSAADETQAKFTETDGILSIVMPKKVIPPLTADMDSVWVVKISKIRALTVAVVAAAVAVVVAFGTQLAQLVHMHPCQHAVSIDHVVIV